MRFIATWCSVSEVWATRMQKLSPPVKVIGTLVLLYLLWVAGFFGYHYVVSIYDYPGGTYPQSLEGTYRVFKETHYQLPDVFGDDELVTIKVDGNGRCVIQNADGSRLSLSEGKNGWYFREGFHPAGAWILPGFALNWNRGHISRQGDEVIVDGEMDEAGLMLFFWPFHDSTVWEVELLPVKSP